MITISTLAPHVCRPGDSIGEVLRRIDASPYLFQIVIDEQDRVVGTITDGDVRRAMMHGTGIDHPARACMQTSPKLGQFATPDRNAEMLAQVRSRNRFLPVVDAERKLRLILIDDGADPGIANALIMAGGPGTRLGERTRNVPKPMLPVGGRPILDHVLERLENAEVKRVFVSVHYLSEQIESYLKERGGRVEVVLVRETERLGTAGALGQLSSTAFTSPLLVVNGDVITKTDFRALHEFHERHGYDGTVAVTRHEIEIPFGVVRYNGEGLFDRIDEKPRLSHFVAAGVYYLSPAFIGLVPPGQPLDMPELLNIGKRIGLKIGLFPIHEYWTDVGRPADLEAAENVHRSDPSA
jgi:dTDP-glucose pyrophosphorylase